MPLVLHGGSGIPDETIRAMKRYGMIQGQHCQRSGGGRSFARLHCDTKQITTRQISPPFFSCAMPLQKWHIKRRWQ